MLKFPCLVLDHDDTVVQSEATVNYPYFCYILDQFRPGTTISLTEYTEGCYHMGFVEMCRQRYGFTDQELTQEYTGWKEYIKDHMPHIFPGIDALIKQQKAAGGLVCVVSHSTKETISRDYNALIGLQPDLIFGWDLPEHHRKPNAYPLKRIMAQYGLSPDQLLVVDDMKPGWEMASKVGCPIAFAGWGRQNCPDIVKEMTDLCDFAFDDPQNLTDFLFN